MKNEFVTYEQTLSLKELGFDEPCLAKHDLKHILLRIEECKNQENAQEFDYILAPLYQQAFKWFREKYDLEGVVQQANDYTWYKFSIYQKSNFYTSEGKVLKSQGLEYETHEEAEQACLDKLIEICKNK
jgi:hypothetical protein